MELSSEAEAKVRRQDYSKRPLLPEVAFVELRRFNDESGSMTELARLAAGRIEGLEAFSVAQVNFSTVEPGAIKAFHVHLRQTDVWFVPPEDKVLLVLVDVRRGSPTEGRSMRMVLGDGRSGLVRIPPGVAHGCRNLGSAPARIVYFTDMHFTPDRAATDEGRLPWDFAGAEIWERSRE